MQSCLEKRSMEARHVQEIRSDYNSENKYSSVHPDARATGDSQGKGTGSLGHSFWLPNCNSEIGVFNYSNFDTSPADNAGNDVDNRTRNESLTRSVYNFENQYSANSVDTSANVAEGQFVIY